MAARVKNALICVDPEVWEQFKRLQKDRESSASRRLRMFMAREVRKAKRNGELAR